MSSRGPRSTRWRGRPHRSSPSPDGRLSASPCVRIPRRQGSGSCADRESQFSRHEPSPVLAAPVVYSRTDFLLFFPGTRPPAHNLGPLEPRRVRKGALGHQRGMGGRKTGDDGHTHRSDTQNHKTRHSAKLTATHPERTSLVTRGRTPSGTRRWALRAASPARHPDAQGARANDRRHAKTGCNPADRQAAG